MGIYVYALRSPKTVRRVALSTGETIRIGSVSYLYKAFVWGTAPRGYAGRMDGLIQRLQNLWNGQVTPRYVALTSNTNGHKIEKGQNVYKWGNNVANYDTVFDESPPVGKVVEVLGA
jgi:hypothetical protein